MAGKGQGRGVIRDLPGHRQPDSAPFGTGAAFQPAGVAAGRARDPVDALHARESEALAFAALQADWIRRAQAVPRRRCRWGSTASSLPGGC